VWLLGETSGYNEGENIGRALEDLYKSVSLPKRVLVVFDFDEDDTLRVVRELAPQFSGVQLVKNTIGRGVLNAICTGVAATSANVVIVTMTMADLSDDLTVVTRMIELIRDEGYDCQ
jgi:dolichol-phosphate mannosyltransferase